MISKPYFQRHLIFLLMLSGVTPGKSQLESYQILFRTDFFTHVFDVIPTNDQGYLITGFEHVPDVSENVPYVCKIDCRGEMEWRKKYGPTSTWDNIDPRLGNFENGDHFLMTTILDANFDILVTRMNSSGETLWKKTHGGNREDIGRGMTILSDGHVLLVGTTKSFGTDAGSNYRDMYALKVNGETGEVIWSKTFGTPNAIDDAWDALENPDGTLMIIGRSADEFGIYMSIFKTDSEGEILWNQFYGKNNHHAQCFEIISDEAGGYFITGFTTVNKESFMDYYDVPILRLDENGEIIWAKVYRSSNPDFFETGSNLVLDNNRLIMSWESAGFPSSNIDITKRLIAVVNPETGELISNKSFNDSGGQFPVIKKDHTGFIISASTDEFDSFWSDPIMIKLDDELNSGCNEVDQTIWTVTEEVEFDKIDIDYTVSFGAK